MLSIMHVSMLRTNIYKIVKLSYVKKANHNSSCPIPTKYVEMCVEL